MKVEDLEKVRRLLSDRELVESMRDEFLTASYIMLRPSHSPGSTRDGEHETAKGHSPEHLPKKLYDAVIEAIDRVLTAERDGLTSRMESYGVTD